jgi:hypothetical protein
VTQVPTSVISCWHVILQLTWPLPFPYTPRLLWSIFLWAECVSGAEICCQLSAKYGHNVLSQQSVCDWILRWSHKWHSGRTIRPPILVHYCWQYWTCMGHSSACIIHENLGFCKVCARWVPKQRTEEHKQHCLEICQCLLNCYWDAFLRHIITGHETWLHYFKPESKCQSLEWKHLTSSVKKKFRTEPKAGKLMLTFFGTCRGRYWNIMWRVVCQTD